MSAQAGPCQGDEETGTERDDEDLGRGIGSYE